VTSGATSNLSYSVFNLPATLNPTVTSPDGTVTGITGTSNGGFTATIQATTATVRFTYSVTTLLTTPVGTFNSTAGTHFNYTWRVRDAANTTTLGSGTSQAALSVIVPVTPTVVSCNSSAGSAPAGGGTVTLYVDCVMTGSSGSIRPAVSNKFTPTSIVFSNGSNTITATLQSAITSPDSSVSFSGTSSGFTGTRASSPMTIRAQYNATTVSTTPAGVYTSPTVTYTWSVI